MKKTDNEVMVHSINGDKNTQIIGSKNIIKNTINYFVKENQDLEKQYKSVILRTIKKTWITEVFEKSIFNETLIALEITETPNAIERPWDMWLQMPNCLDKKIPITTSIDQVFNELNSSMLILGEPGAGKTTTLLELTRDLLQKADSGDINLTPVFLNLSSWTDKNENLDNWIISEMNNKYYIPEKIARKWIENNEIIALLDGLDEVSPTIRNKCCKAINLFRLTHGIIPIVVSCRTNDYLILENRLQLNGAVKIEPLSLVQIDHYLDQLGPHFTTLKKILHNNNYLLELAHQPLMLNIIVLAHKGKNIESSIDQRYNSTEGYRRSVFDAYIKAMFNRVARTKNTKFSPENSIRWLTWLAQNLIEHNQTELQIDKIDETWIPIYKQRQILSFLKNFLFKLLGMFLIGFGLFTIGSTINKPIGQIFGAAIGGLLGWWIYGYISGVQKSFASMKITWRHTLLGCISGAILCVSTHYVYSHLGTLVSAIVGGVLMGLFYGTNLFISDNNYQSQWSWTNAGIGSLLGVYFGLLNTNVQWVKHTIVVSLAFGFLLGITTDKIENDLSPNYIFNHSLRNSIIVGVLSCVIIGAILNWTNGLTFGLYAFLVFGGGYSISYILLKLFLKHNNFIAFKLHAFLEYSVERIFLRKVGRGYIFIHRLLLEHFAEIKYDEKSIISIAHRGEAYRRMGKYNQAVTDFSNAIQLDDKYGWAYAHRGETYFLMGRVDEAIDDLTKAIEFDNNKDNQKFQRGYIYFRSHKYEKALQDFFQLLRKKYWNLYSYIAEIFLLTGKFNDSLIKANLSLLRNQNSNWSFYLRAMANKMLGREDKFREDIRTAIANAKISMTERPTDLTVQANLALYELSLNNVDQSSKIYKTLIENFDCDLEIIDSIIFDLENYCTLLNDNSEAKRFLTLFLHKKEKLIRKIHTDSFSF